MLTPPSIVELEAFRREATLPDDEASVTLFLEAATDLMTIATGLIEMPTDPIALRTLKRGILDMSWYLGVSLDERDALFSPFSSERIGSYSYSKAQVAVSTGTLSGVPFFDIAVAYFTDLAGTEGSSWSSSEQVMPKTLAESRDPLNLLTSDVGGVSWL